MTSRQCPDSAIVEIDEILVNDRTGTKHYNSGRFMAFLCPACNDVHLVFNYDGIKEQFHMSLTPEKAEKFSALLVAPQIIE